MARVGVVWHRLARGDNWGMPTLAGWTSGRAARGAASVSMAPGATFVLAARMVVLYLMGRWCAPVMKILRKSRFSGGI